MAGLRDGGDGEMTKMAGNAGLWMAGWWDGGMAGWLGGGMVGWRNGEMAMMAGIAIHWYGGIKG